MSVMCLYRAVVAKSNGQKEQMIPLFPYETTGSLSPWGCQSSWKGAVMAALLVQLPMLELVPKSCISQPLWWFWDNQYPPEAGVVMLKE